MRSNEWHPEGTSSATGTLLATKLKNQLLALDPDLDVRLKNVAVNGVKMGCTGFVANAAGQIVYVCTDHNHGTRMDQPYFRTAEHFKDYRGGSNRSSTNARLAHDVVELLRDYPTTV